MVPARSDNLERLSNGLATEDFRLPHLTAADLAKIHVRIGHAHWRRMHRFLKRPRPDIIPPNVMPLLRDIVKNCCSCQRRVPTPRLVTVSLPDGEGKFNEQILIVIFHIGDRNALSIVCRSTKYVAASFLDTISAESVWEATLTCWYLRYLGHPHIILTDRGTQFVAKYLQKWAGEAGILTDSVGMESPSSLGLGERVHGPLSRTYDALAADARNAGSLTPSPELLLQMACKGWSDTNGIDGLVPSLLVYGAWPSLLLDSHHSAALPHSGRAKFREAALREMRAAIDDARAEAKDQAKSPTIPDDLAPGGMVLVYRKDPSMLAGPYPLVLETPRGFYVRSSNARGREVQLHAKASVKRYLDGILIESLLPPSCTATNAADADDPIDLSVEPFIPESGQGRWKYWHRECRRWE